jgi:hypothetical protein
MGDRTAGAPASVESRVVSKQMRTFSAILPPFQQKTYPLYLVAPSGARNNVVAPYLN